MNAQDYYSDDANLGSYQYVKLSEVIDDFVFQSHDERSHLYGLGKGFIVRHAKSAIRTINKEYPHDVKALELTIGDDLMFKLPQDFVDYVRVSVVTGNTTLAPLDINSNMNVAPTYLQDHEYKVMFNHEGEVLQSDGQNMVNEQYKAYQVQTAYSNGGHQQLDTSKMTRTGEYTIDKRRGVIFFSNNMLDKNVVLEYLSDGVEWEKVHETEISFHKHLHDAVKDLTYYNCVETATNVPYNEKYRARQKYKTNLHLAKVNMSGISIQAIKKVWRKGAKWVKS